MWHRIVLMSWVALVAPVAVPAVAEPPRYDPRTEVEVSGRVENVAEIAEGRRSRRPGVHLDLEDAGGKRYDVHLGPRSFLDQIGFVPSVGDELRVTGSRHDVPPDGIILVAREVVRGTSVFVLRDADGRPMWRRGR